MNVFANFLKLLLVFMSGMLLLVLSACNQQQLNSASDHNYIQLSELLSGDGSDNFAKVLTERKFNFPRDHAAHPDYRQEWWYFTGNLQTAEGRRYGYELTFFRVGLHPLKAESGRESLTSATIQQSKPGNVSLWRTNQIYMAHLAVTDIENDKFYTGEQFSRDAMRLAGAEIDTSEKLTGDSTQLRVWLGDWSASSINSSVFPLRLTAKGKDFSISLVLDKSKPIVLQGNNGLSVKGDKPGSASYYYSVTRMATDGEIQIGDDTFAVKGNSWFDREWFTSQLEPEQQGWDWFALQLDDDRDLMFFSMRRKDGSLDLHSAGALIEADGQYKYLNAGDVNLEVIRQWHSYDSNVTYPAGWKIFIPAETLELQVTPAIDNQELTNTAIRYWEGSVKISGKYKNNNKIVAGRGYVELAGYPPDNS